MKKVVALFLVVSTLLSCVGCAPAHSCENSCESCGLCLNQACEKAACQEKCQGHHSCANPCADCGLCTNESCKEAVCKAKCLGHHSCANPCADCGLCTNESCAEAICAKKCPGHHNCANICPDCGLCTNKSCSEAACHEKCQGHQVQIYPFPSGDYITTEAVSIDTGTFVYDIDPGIYVRGDLQEITNVVIPLIEQFAGLDFNVEGYRSRFSPDGKVHLTVTRDIVHTEANPNNEFGRAFVSGNHHVMLSPGDLFLGSSALVHEASHELMFRQSEWKHGEMLNESISTYTTYLVEKELEKTNPGIALYMGTSFQSLVNLEIYDYSKLYEKPLDYWFKYNFEYAANNNYAIGFRFAAYLHEVYGDYTSWITKFEEMYPLDAQKTKVYTASTGQQIAVFMATYGEDVLDNFYPWLEENREKFDIDYKIPYTDLTAAGGINLYPTCSAIETRVRIEHFEYKDLYINLDTVHTYLEEYKGLDTTGLTLHTSQPVTVELYQADGSFTTVTTDSDIPLEGITCIRLVGEGKLDLLEILGPFRYWYLDE